MNEPMIELGEHKAVSQPIDRIAARYEEFIRARLDERQYTAYASHSNMIGDLKWFLDLSGLIDAALVERLDKWINGEPRRRRLTVEQVDDIARALAYINRMRQRNE